MFCCFVFLRKTETWNVTKTKRCHFCDKKTDDFFLDSFVFIFVESYFLFAQFSDLYQRDKIMSAEFEWNLIVLLQRQGKDCISMKWSIDLSDESPAPPRACHAAQFLWEPSSSESEANDLHHFFLWFFFISLPLCQYLYFAWETVIWIKKETILLLNPQPIWHLL